MWHAFRGTHKATSLLGALVVLACFAWQFLGVVQQGLAQDELSIVRLKGHTDLVPSVAFSPDGRFALSGSADKTLILWDVATGDPVRTFTEHTDWVRSVAFSPDGRFALSGSFDNTLILWDVATGYPVRTFRGHTYWVLSVAFSPDGRFALSWSDDGTIRLWDTD